MPGTDPAATRKSWPRNTVPATAAHVRNAAERAVDDPVQLARAARIVRAALARQRLTLADLDGNGDAA